VASGRPPAHQRTAHHAWLRRALDPTASGAAAEAAASRFDLPRRPLTVMLGRAAAFDPVLVHGDVHEDQLLVHDGRVCGVVDWETARVDHPFFDFDLGEWGTGAWRAGRGELDRTWHAMWASYADARGVDADHRPLAVASRLRLAWWAVDPRAPAPPVVGPVGEHRAAVLRLLAPPVGLG
jgi:aminoglycoside phosphotransferase (APT) family kinase protein